MYILKRKGGHRNDKLITLSGEQIAQSAILRGATGFIGKFLPATFKVVSDDNKNYCSNGNKLKIKVLKQWHLVYSSVAGLREYK